MKFTKEQKLQIVESYNNGLSTRAVAEKFSTTQYYVIKILDEMQMPLRKKKGIKHCVHHRVVDLDVWKSQEGTEQFDYFLGIFATDGCITGTSIALEFAENNKEILELYNSFLGNVCNINSRYCNKRNNTYYSIKYKNQDIVDYLYMYGITPKKTNTLKLKYINWNVLRGIFDGDGSLVRDKRCCSFKFKITSGSLEFIKQLEEFYRENNLYYTIETVTASKNPYYNIMIHRQQDILFIYNNMYKDSSFFLHRKKEKFGPLLEKFNSCNSVNSVNERENSKTEPSLNQEGAETRNGEPK